MRPIQVLKLTGHVSGGGGGGLLDTQTVTVGTSGTAANGDRFRGYTAGPPSQGSISDGSSNVFSGATILELGWDEGGPGWYFTVSGTFSDSGWTSMTIGGTVTLNRASANSFLHAAGNTTWFWSGGVPGAGNGFGGTAGVLKTVTWS